MLESKVQAILIKSLEKSGWYVIKIMRANKGGIPDLIAVKDGKAVFIEAKRPDVGKLSPVQEYRINEMRAYCDVVVADSINDIKHLL